MDLVLKGRKAIVTGGSRGLGKMVARNLAAEGCSVAIGARNMGPLEEAAREISNETGSRVLPLACDMTDGSAIESFVAAAAAGLGGIEIVVNCAARTGGMSEELDVYETADEDQMMEDFREKVVGMLRLVRSAEPYLKQAGWGRVIGISGGAGRIRGQRVSAGTRNRALNNLIVSIANALGPFGVSALSISPGRIVTERQLDAHARAAEQQGITLDAYLKQRAEKTTLLGRLVTSQDLANVVAMLCSPLTWPINGSTIEVNGGSSPDVRYDLTPMIAWEPGTAR